MKFIDFSNYLQKLETTPSRLEMTEILAELFNSLDTSEIAQACYLMQGKIVPAYKSLEFQLSVKMNIRALARISANSHPDVNQTSPTNLFSEPDYGQVETEVSARFKKIGDLGVLAEQILAELPAPQSQLSILDVFSVLTQIANESGQGSQERKLQGLVDLLQKLDSVSAKFVVRIVMGKLRLGFSTMTMLDALSWARVKNKSLSSTLEEYYQKKADIGRLAQAYLSSAHGADLKQTLADYSVEIGIPVLPALCQRLNSASEIIEKMIKVYVEPKYDGLRIQIHFKRTPHLAQAFTRSLENVTHMFPELDGLANELNCEECILDAEAIGYDRKTGKLRAFQDTITRKRKHDVADQADQVPIKFFVFDVLLVDGKSLIDEPLSKRKEVVKTLFKNGDILSQTQFIETSNPDEVRDFHNQQLGDGLEGAVIKKIDSEYRSGRKGWRWVKIKEEEGSQGKLSDTLDCVVMGHYVGRGKRTQFGVGAFLVGVLGKEQQILTIAKIGTGLTDDEFRELKIRSDGLLSPKKPAVYQVPKGLIPDAWLKPGLVVEIAADEITRSPTHTAGVALRFPRLVKFRDDKTWEQATSLEEVGKIKIG